MGVCIHEYVEPFQIPAAQPQIIQCQPAKPQTFSCASIHAGEAQLLAGIVGEPAPDARVHDRAEHDMLPPAPIERLTAAIADIARPGHAHETRLPPLQKYSITGSGVIQIFNNPV
jgi:hypothetical protein